MTTTTMTLSVTGHRSLPPGAPMVIRSTVRQLVDRYPGATWVTGGAIGTDQIATDELLKLGQRIEVVLPFVPDIHTAKWTPTQRQELLEQLERVTKPIEIMRTEYDVAGYHERNRRLVERADLLVAVWNGRNDSGTASTVKQAARQGVPVYWVPVAR
jgi:predicted Rossmann fold nucleotide-binding protein DprA/Smf involved in DNA uptake